MATTPHTLRQEPSTNGSSARRRQPLQQAVGTTARASARNRSRILVGCLLALGCAFAAAVLYSDAGERRPVLVVARPVAAGQAIEAADLREVMVATDGDVETISASDRSDIVGRTASVPLAAGSMLTADQVGDSMLLDPSEAVLGAVLGEGLYPAELRAGDRVLLYEVPNATDEGQAGEALRATVVALREGHAPGSVNATLSVAAADAGAVAMAAAQDRLIVVLAPR